MTQERHEKAFVAVDAVIFTIHDASLKVLLKTREKEPERGKQELIGGLLLPHETAEDALKRKLKQTIGTEGIFFNQFHTFTAPKRDSRGRAISIGFIALINEQRVKNINAWHSIKKLPPLAFDHKDIIEQAHRYLQDNLDTAIIKQFMPDFFPLNKLQEAYEIIEGQRIDNRNFRKKIISSGIVRETNKVETKVKHRPAKIYSFKK